VFILCVVTLASHTRLQLLPGHRRWFVWGRFVSGRGQGDGKWEMIKKEGRRGGGKEI